jgi:hypothetical protein
MRRYLSLALVAGLLILPSLASAQTKTGVNGGPVVTSEGHPIEFVRNGLEITFYLSDDDGSPLSTKNMRGRATIQDGGKTTTVQLSPSGPNKMVGKLQSELSRQARVVFSASLHGHSLTARYTVQ